MNMDFPILVAIHGSLDTIASSVILGYAKEEEFSYVHPSTDHIPGAKVKLGEVAQFCSSLPYKYATLATDQMVPGMPEGSLPRIDITLFSDNSCLVLVRLGEIGPKFIPISLEAHDSLADFFESYGIPSDLEINFSESIPQTN